MIAKKSCHCLSFCNCFFFIFLFLLLITEIDVEMHGVTMSLYTIALSALNIHVEERFQQYGETINRDFNEVLR